ncbi:OmpA family protein [Neolewinella lacunae]|uniref:OmpA family protein n=1 Tax=Neolewinella lacunae TaxID=1517758 RepID=A0A923PIF1_9BACT|nr:OmpA family protein [Neolewinella lacunae]MBC6994733.1 OmpA family protein [Neolewinella lacunae]MDN3634605.1 OmpA family protein [Neolewinella lacunae]
MKSLLFFLALLSATLQLSGQCATIYFYRPMALTGEAKLAVSYVGGDKLFDLPYGSYVVASACTEGQYFFRVLVEGTVYGDRMELSVRPGQDYYVRVGTSIGIEIPSMKLQEKAKGIREVSRSNGFPQGSRQFSLPAPGATPPTPGPDPVVTGGGGTPGAQRLPGPQTHGGFRFTPTAITKSGALLKIDYQIENLTNADRELFASGLNITFYDQAGNLLKGNGVHCIMGNCVDNAGIDIQVYSENSNGRYIGEGSQGNVMAVIPYGIPVKASITIGGIRNESRTLVRGQVFFWGRSPTNHTDVTDICLNYGPILIPNTQDASNPRRHNMGDQSVEIREAKLENGRVVVSGVWMNNSNTPHQLNISSGRIVNDAGTQQNLEQVRFGGEAQPVAIGSYRSNYPVNASYSLPFTLIAEATNTPVREIRRLTINFGAFELSWDNFTIGQPYAPTPRPSTTPITPPVSSTPGGNYLSYTDFERAASTNGSVQGKKVILENINFNLGSDVILPESFPQLNKLASLLERKPALRLEITGYTDDIGAAVDNLLLSQKRADAVRYYLISKSIAPARMTSLGKGQTESIASNSTEAGRKLNRRVEIRAID